jgi:GAF domain-containing protein
MGVAKLVMEEPITGAMSAIHPIDSAEQLAVWNLDEHYRHLVEKAATLVGASRASLGVLDPTTQTLALVASFAQRLTGPIQAGLYTHERIARWAIEHRSYFVIDNLANDRRIQAFDSTASGSLLCVPLVAGQQAVGALTLSSPSLNAFRPQHLTLIELLADMAAVTVLQARQIESTSLQTQHLRTLFDLSRRLNNPNDAQRVFGLAVAGIRRLVRCEEAVIFQYQARDRTLSGVAGLGVESAQLAERHIRLDDPQSVTAWVANQRRPLLHSIGARAFVGPATETLMTKRDMALLAVPLVAEKQLWGVITLARQQAFTNSELRMLLTLSGMIAPALAHIERAGQD